MQILERILDARGIRRRWLARQLGISDAYLSRLLSGEKRWPPRLRAETARVLMLPEDVLFFDFDCRSPLQEPSVEPTPEEPAQAADK